MRLAISLAALLLAAASSGCTTASMDGVSAAAAPDPALPETVSVAPSPARAAGEAVASVGNAAAEGAEAITAPVMSLAGTAAAGTAQVFDDIVGKEKGRTKLDQLITAYAAHYQVPETLVRRVIKRESNFRPQARNGPYWGLMQIRHDTARGMGYNGSASGLLDAETNLKYAVRYLRGAYLVAKGNHDLAVRFYARGYYYDAKRAGLLDETGLGRDRRRMR